MAKTTKGFFKKSRSEKRAENNLGIILGDSANNKVLEGRCRTEQLDILDQYYNNTQYDDLQDWKDCEATGEHVPLRNKKPRLIFPFAKVLACRLASKLVGQNTYPTLSIEDDPDTEEFLKIISKSSFLRPKFLDVAKLMVGYSSAFARFKIVAGSPKMEVFNSKWCHPKFDDSGELEEVRIQYVFKDPLDLDRKGTPIEKWFKLMLTKTTDTLFDNPIFKAGQEPPFQTVESVNHDFGFVQGEWFRTSDDLHSPDGNMIVWDLLSFIDSLNYNLSQSDRAAAYGVDPQVVIKGLDEDEITELIKSSTKAWMMGRDGDAKFLEVSGSGLQRSAEQRDDTIQRIQDIARIVFLDPEKIVGSAQSAKAMEVLHGPMVELINELRPWMEKGIISIHQKIMLALLIMKKRGVELAITIPDNFVPKSLDIRVQWPQIFPMTMQDLQQKVGIGVQLTSGNIMSRETVLRWLLKDFEGLIDNVEEEIIRIDTQKEFNTFNF